MGMLRSAFQAALLMSLAACSAPAWSKTGWLREDVVRAVDAYFPEYRIFEQDVETLNRNLQ